MTEIIPLSDLSLSSRNGGSKVDGRITGGIVTIGNFDGVHRGHAALLGQVCSRAKARGGPAIAVVLDPHPAAILRPEMAPPKLTGITRRAELMDRLGVDFLVVCQTTPAFLKLTAEEFFQTLVIQILAAAGMVEGPNFFFGRDRGGDIGVLRTLCRASSIDLQIVEPTKYAGKMISSTRIRGLLDAGDVEQALVQLGTPYQIGGIIETGAARGRTIGFPTANLTDIDVVVPGFGVYAGLATVASETHQAAIHIGPNPTFEEDGAVKVEVHLLDFAGDIYGERLTVEFVSRIRDVVRFDSPQQLVEQLGRDIQTARDRLTQYRQSRS